MSKSHVLYRFYSATGQLLYVGITMNPVQRFKSHRGTKDWWEDVAGISIERYPTREDLANAERRAIRVERPMHNVVHTLKPRRETVPQESVPDTPSPEMPALSEEQIKNLFSTSAPTVLDSLFGPPHRWTCYGYVTDEEYEKRASVDRAKREAVEACPYCDHLGYRNMYICNHVEPQKTRLRVVSGGDA